MLCTRSVKMPTASAISRTFSWRFFIIMLWIFSTMSNVVISTGRSEHALSSMQNTTDQPKKCETDQDCEIPEQYCYQSSKICVNHTSCEIYNRVFKLARDPAKCGPCKEGYEAEILVTGDIAPFCKKISTYVPKIPEESDNNNIWWIVFGISLLLVIIAGIYFGWKIFYCIKNRICCYNVNKISRDEENPGSVDQRNLCEASALPEHVAFKIVRSKSEKSLEKSEKSLENHCLSICNNNTNRMVNNHVQRARPFHQPVWVRNPNLSDDSNDINTNNTVQENMATESHNLLVADNNINRNNRISQDVRLQMLPEYPMEREDNVRSVLLLQDSHSTFDDSASGNTDSFTFNGNHYGCQYDGATTVNLNMNQSIVMCMNLHNVD